MARRALLDRSTSFFLLVRAIVRPSTRPSLCHRAIPAGSISLRFIRRASKVRSTRGLRHHRGLPGVLNQGLTLEAPRIADLARVRAGARARKTLPRHLSQANLRSRAKRSTRDLACGSAQDAQLTLEPSRPIAGRWHAVIDSPYCGIKAGRRFSECDVVPRLRKEAARRSAARAR
jgi:hypothetical protein